MNSCDDRFQTQAARAREVACGEGRRPGLSLLPMASLLGGAYVSRTNYRVGRQRVNQGNHGRNREMRFLVQDALLVGCKGETWSADARK